MEMTLMRKCRWCGREFPTYLLLFQHRRVHSIYRPYVCSYATCCQAFSCASDLQRHCRTHFDRRIYMCNICKTRFLYRHHLKLHRCRIRNTKVYKCHLCSETFVQCLSLAHHIRRGHQHFAKRKAWSARNNLRMNKKGVDRTNRKVYRERKEDKSGKNEDGGQQKILLKIKAGTCTTLISPGKEMPPGKEMKLKSSHMKHKRKKAKRKLDIMQPAVSMKNGLILKIRPVLKPESKKLLKKHSKSRTKLKHENNENTPVHQPHGLKLKIRTDQGNSHVILNSETEQKVPKLLVSKRNLENVQKSLSKLSGSVLTSKNIVKKYKNKKAVLENAVESDGVELDSADKEGETLVPRVKNGIIIHKDRLGNYTSAEQIGKTDPKAVDIPKCTEGMWKKDKSERTKTPKSKKHDVPKFARGIWEVMPSPRPDGTPDLLKIRLSPQKPPPRLETNPDILYESSKLFGIYGRSRTDTVLSEDSDTFGASPATEKDLELGISSVHDSGIEVLSSSSCNRSNGNSVRSVLLDENSPTYFQGEDSLMSFDSPGNDSSKYEHSICGKCGGIVMEQNNNTYSPTKCHCDLNSPSQDFHEKAGYIYISPLKDPSVSNVHKKASPKFKLDDKITYTSVTSESSENFSNVCELNEKVSVNESTSLLLDDSQHESEKSVFDFNEDEDFSSEKPVLDHVKNPRVLSKTEDEKKQESILLADLQQPKEPETPKKRSKNNKLSRSPRRKSAKDMLEKNDIIETSPGHKVGLTPSKPIIIEEEPPVTEDKDLKMTLRAKTTNVLPEDKSCLLDQGKDQIFSNNDFGLQLKNKVMNESSEPIIVAIAKTDKTAEKESEKNNENKTKTEKDEQVRKSRNGLNASDVDRDENGKATVNKNGDKVNDLKNGGNISDDQNSGNDIGNHPIETLDLNNDSDVEVINMGNASEEQNAKMKEQQKAEKEDHAQVEEIETGKKNDSKSKDANSKVHENDPTLRGFDETSQKLIEYLEANGIGEEVPDVLCSANNDSGIEEIHLYTKTCTNSLLKSVESFVKEASGVKGNKNRLNEILKEDGKMQSPVQNHTSEKSSSVINEMVDLEEVVNEVANVEEDINPINETVNKAEHSVSLEKDIENDATENEIIAFESDIQISKDKGTSKDIDTHVEKETIEKSFEKETIEKSNSVDNVVDKVIEQLESESESEMNESESIQSLLKPIIDQQKDKNMEKKKLKPPPVILKDFDEDSLLQVPVPDNETDLTAALEQAGLGVKTTVVMNPDEDIPEVRNPALAKPSSSTVIKSPLDLFQQQFLSFLSSKSPEPEKSDHGKENKKKGAKRTKRKVSNKKSKSDVKEPQKSAMTQNHISSVDLIVDGSSDSDFELSGPKNKKRRKSSLTENTEAHSDSVVEDKNHERTKGRKASLKDNSKVDSGSRKSSSSNIIIVKSPNLEDDIQIELPRPDSDSDFEPHNQGTEHMKKSVVKKTPTTSNVNHSRTNLEDYIQNELPQPDSDSDFEPHNQGTEHMKMSVVKKAPKTSNVSHSRTRKHRDFGSDDSDFVISDSELERAGSSESDFNDPFEPKVKRLKSCRQRRESVRQRVTSVNEDDDNSKDSKDDLQGLFDTQSSEKADRSKRSKRGRKSICPCCIGSPGMHRKESHEYKPTYKLPKNHKQFIADTIRLLEMKAKIHRLFLSLFPECKELITQSDINTIAFDDLIDDVLSTLKSDVQFEPGSDIFAEQETNISNEPLVEQVVDENFQQVVGDTVQQLVDETVNNETVENSTNSEFESDHLSQNPSSVMTENEAFVFVPGIHLMFSDDSVITTSQIPENDLESSDSMTTLANLLPTLPTLDTDRKNSENAETETVLNEQTENETNVQENAENGVRDVSEEPQITTVDQNVPDMDNVKSEFSLSVSSSQVKKVLSETSAHDPDISYVVQQNEPVVTTDAVFMNDIVTSDAVSVLTTIDPNCSSLEQIPVNIFNEIQPVETETASVIPENNCEEIVITIDLSAAKVQLCRNPKSCLKQLQLKIVRLIWCLLPDLQVSSSVYESLENLEFLLDLIIMSNNSIEETNSFPSKMASTLKTKHSISKRSENCSNSLSSSQRLGRKPLLRRQSELSIRELRNRKQTRESLKKRTKSTEKAVILKKLKTKENNSEKLQHNIVHKSPLKHTKSSDMIKRQKSAPAISRSHRNSTGKLTQPSKVTDAEIIGAVAKKYSSEKSKVKESEKVMPTDTIKMSENVQFPIKIKSVDKERTDTQLTQVEGSAKTTETVAARSGILFELEFENSIDVKKDVLNDTFEEKILDNAATRTNDRNSGNIFERMDSLKNERSEGNIFEIMDSVKTDRNDGSIFEKIDSVASERNEKLTSPINVSLSSPVRTPSPEKSIGSFSPDNKRRSSDKNIFELLQPVPTDT